MFTETSTATAAANTPTEICAVVEKTTRKRAANPPQKFRDDTQRAPIANETAIRRAKPKAVSPLVSNPITQDAATHPSQPTMGTPRPEWASGHVALEPYDPEPNADAIAQIITLHRRRQGAIATKTKITLAMMATVRSILCRDEDFVEDTDSDKVTAFGRKPRKLTKDAKERVDGAIKAAKAEIKSGRVASDIAGHIAAYVASIDLFEKQCDDYAKQMVKQAKHLPVFKWAKNVNGFGDISFATIVGECGDIGTYKSVSAVWKRLGLAVFNGNRQGNPGAGATADDWIEHGYNKVRRSVSWNARNQIIGAMGLWRPDFGSDLSDATYYQRIFAERARYESQKLGLPIEAKTNAKGVVKESYKNHVINRAMRYVEKRLLRNLYIEWRRHPAQA